MKLSSWCLWPASLSLAAVLGPAGLDRLAGADAGPPAHKQGEKHHQPASLNRMEEWVESWTRSYTAYDKMPPFPRTRNGTKSLQKGRPRWGERPGRLSDKDFCSLVRSMQFVARGLVCDTLNMLPHRIPKDFAVIIRGPCKRSSSIEATARMMMSLELLLRVLKRQLARSQALSLQMHCAVCYVEYSRQASQWLVAMREQAHKFRWREADRDIMISRLDAIAELQMEVGEALHKSKKHGFINEDIPEVDYTGWAEKIQRLYGKEPETKLRDWVQDEDPAFPFEYEGRFWWAKHQWNRDPPWDVPHLHVVSKTKRSDPHGYNASTISPASVT